MQGPGQGSFVSAAAAELLDKPELEDSLASEPSTSAVRVEDLGSGNKKKKPNTLYNSDKFWRHHDHEAEVKDFTAD